MTPEQTERIGRELAVLAGGGQRALLLSAGPPTTRDCVIYYAVPTGGACYSLPIETDVLVPVPSGYPAVTLDLAGLPAGSALLPRVVGGPNCQGTLTADGRQWSLASYHPHGNGGGPPWNPMEHGFHTYFDYLLTWVTRIL